MESSCMDKENQPPGGSTSTLSTGTKEQLVALLANMPNNCDPIRYLQTMRKKFVKNTLEDATMRKLMKNQLTFFTNKSRLEQSVPRHILFPVKKYGQKYASAPNSPLISHKENSQNSTDLVPFKKLKGMESDSETSTASSSSTTSGTTELSRPECVYVHLVAAIEYENVNQIVVKGRKNDWTKGIQEPFQLIRSLSKKIGELIDILGLGTDLDEKYWNIAAKAAKTVGEIYEAFSENPNCKEMFTLAETGIECFLEKAVNILVENEESKAWTTDMDLSVAWTDVKRTRLVEEMIEGMKSVPVRHLMLDKLLTGMKLVLKRFVKSLNLETPAVIKLGDISGSFWLLQFVENILVTTRKETPWIAETLWDKFCWMEETAMHRVKLCHIVVHILRQVNLAKPLVKFSDSDSDTSE